MKIRRVNPLPLSPLAQQQQRLEGTGAQAGVALRGESQNEKGSPLTPEPARAGVSPRYRRD